MANGRLLICGDRNWTSRRVMYDVFTFYGPVLVIHGCAAGADSMAGDVAKELGIPVFEFPADWKTHGKAAGPIRNLRMLNEGKPDAVVGLHNDLKGSKGTKHMLRIAAEACIETALFTELKSAWLYREFM